MVRISDELILRLNNRIAESIRTDRTHLSKYIDSEAGNLSKIKLDRSVVVFGRRGSGKTRLLCEFEKSCNPRIQKVIWIDVDLFKHLSCAEVVIQILRKLLKVLADNVANGLSWYALKRRKQAKAIVKELDSLEDELVDLLRDPDENKMTRIYRYLQDLKVTIAHASLQAGLKNLYLVLDDFYQLNIDEQADVLDFLQNLCKNSNLYLKFGTIPHRSCLYRKGKLTVGMQVAHDVQPIDLDRSFQNFPAVEEFLKNLWNNICKSVNRKIDFNSIFDTHSWRQLILASGGVPRDFMNILSRAIDIARASQKELLDVSTINEAANLYLLETKREDLRFDAARISDKLENLLDELIDFCVKEHKSNLFLISKDEMRKYPTINEMLKQLLDFRFIHRVHENISAHNQGSRFEAFMLDLGLYGHLQQSLESRIEQKSFWVRDETKRVRIISSSPIYNLKKLEKKIQAWQETKEDKKEEKKEELKEEKKAEKEDAPKKVKVKE